MKYNLTTIMCLILCGGILLFESCNIINPDEVIPSYIYIKDFTFSCDESQGYPSSKITDGWVYANNVFIGTYELPVTIPVLSSGATDIIVYPGIKENGISGTGIIYPFYTAYTVTADLTELETDTISPSCTYKAGAESFIFLEDFDFGNSFISVESEATWTKTFVDSLVFEGVSSGVASMAGENDTMRIAANYITLPTQDKSLFLEIDYRCDISYQVWLNCNTSSGTTISSSVLTVTPKDYWNKIYINLNPKIQFYSEYDPDTYNLEFRAYKPSDTESAYLYFDNIKIISSL